MCGTQSSISLLRTVLGPKLWSSFDKVHFTLHKGIFTKSSKPNLFSISLRTPSLVLLPFAVLPSILYQTLSWGRKSALLTNILGLSFSHNALSLLKLDSFKTGTILLSGLFIYDIWWVFGTEVMVKVATNLDLPIKILWPKSAVFDSSKGYTMLGLGDIVIPGTFIALALRYDYYRHTVATKSTPEATSTAYAKPYFTAGLIAYVSGLVTTMTVMHVFKAAQPALLYLSPACILSFLGTAAVRGELGEAWKWADDPAKEKEDAKKKEEDKKKKTGEESPLIDQTQEGAGTGGYGAVIKGAAGESRENVADE
jgi:minor histocompatibility antigen H13